MSINKILRNPTAVIGLLLLAFFIYPIGYIFLAIFCFANIPIIKSNTLACYACIPSNVRDVPLTHPINQATYHLDLDFSPSTATISYDSSGTADEIKNELNKYFIQTGYSKIKEESIKLPGENIKHSIFVRKHTRDENRDYGSDKYKVFFEVSITIEEGEYQKVLMHAEEWYE